MPGGRSLRCCILHGWVGGMGGGPCGTAHENLFSHDRDDFGHTIVSHTVCRLRFYGLSRKSFELENDTDFFGSIKLR